jgi:uncharacterized protein (TIGR03437 family)
MCHGFRVGTTFRFSIAWFVLLSALSFASTTRAATITVPAGGSLQAAINAAQRGDTIILQAGAEYVCNSPCVLPVKAGTEYVSIVSSRVGEISGRAPATASPLFARVRSFYSTEAVFATAPGAHHYRIAGLDIAPSQSANAYAILTLGDGGALQNTMEKVPQFFIIEKNWIHGWPDRESQRAIALSSGNTIIRDNSITEVHGLGYDTQAIACWNGPGPYEITNNLLIGAGENVMFGGSPASIPNLIPSDITVRNNYFLKPLSWYANDPSYAGRHWSVKNLFELKNARRVLVEGNIFEGNWTDAQAGRAIVFTPRPSDSGSWAVIEDVEFRNNIVKDVGSGILILGHDEPPAPTETRLRRVKVTNNIFVVDGPRFSSNGVFATVIARTEDVTIEHNTAIQTGNIISTDYEPNVRFIYRDNISRHNDYGIIGSGHGIGNDSIAYYFPNGVISANVIAKEVNAPSNVESIYPAGNYAPANLDAVGFVDWRNGNYRLASSSPYKGAGTGGTDSGCNIDALNAALGGTASPSPTPTPTPTPSPSPTPTPSPTATPTPTPAPTPTPTQLSVSITAPQSNSMFNSGVNITIGASASSPSGSITTVDFYDGSLLIGTSTTSPYSVVWANAASGSHSLTAVARDNTGNAVTSSPVTVKISKSLNGVRNNKRSASTLIGSGSGGNNGELAEPINFDALASSLEQTYYDFADERSMFNSSNTIDRSLFAALLLARSSAGLARQSASAAVNDRLDKIEAYLSICEDLMVRDVISNSTLVHANQVNASVGLQITQPIASSVGSGSLLLPTNLARLVVSSSTPFTQQTLISSGSYELGGVSVSINGQAASLGAISPTEIVFTVPAGLWGGLGDVVVTSRAGYVSHSTAAIHGLNPVIFKWAGDPSDRGAALDALSFQSTIFTVANGPFNVDNWSRMSIWASGITTGVANSDTGNDVILATGRVLQNVAEGISVEARLVDGRTFMLPVAYAGPQGSIVGMDQINVVLVPELSGAGDVQLTIVVGNVRSNTLRVVVR